MATLDIHDVSKSYGSTTGIDRLSLSVDDGEFFVILGPSGAGKTTTLKSIAGLIEIDAGSVEIGGRPMAGVEPYQRNVAMAFESYALYPQKTVFENLASPLRSGRTGDYDATEQRRRVADVTETLGIAHLLERFPRELSNGQRQRVALGRVLVRPADIYLLDEPLSHLDAKLRAAMRAELKQLGVMSSTTSVYVTHDYQEALSLGDRIAVLRDGALVQVGTALEIWRQPVDTFVAKALGQPEINLIDATVDDGAVRTRDGALTLPLTGDVSAEAGDAVRIGVRPRDLDLADGSVAPDGHITVPGTVVLAERLGRQIELQVSVGDTDLIVVPDADLRVPEGDRVDVLIPLDDVHIFAADPPGEESARLGGLGGPANGGAR